VPNASPDTSTDAAHGPPSMLASLSALGVMVVAILVAVFLFGGEVDSGPLQVAMTIGLAAAVLIAAASARERPKELLGEAMVSGITSAIATFFVIIAIGMLVSSLLLAGTIPTMLSYGAELATPSVLYPVALVLATFIGVILGSSFTTVAGLGVPFVALAPLMGLSPEITAAAVVAGAFTGDGIARVSDTLVLTVDMVGGVTPARQSALMLRLLAPAWIATLALMVVLGLRDGGGSFDGAAVTTVIETEFSVSLLCLVPLIVVFVMSSRATAFFAVLAGALSAVVLAGFTQRDLIERLAGDDRAYIVQWAEVSIDTLANGFELNSATAELNDVFFGGGAVGLLPTVWLILVASAYGGLMSRTGMLTTAIAPLLRWAKTPSRLIVASAATTTGFNLAMADPYVSIIVGSETYRDRFKQARLEPVAQSASIAASGSLLSSIIPWNVHGAFVAGVLGIGTLGFAGYAVVIWATPLVLIAAAIWLSRKDVIPPATDPDDVYGAAPAKPPERRTSI
jgi:NhaC family Na+:H+ antiporter